MTPQEKIAHVLAGGVQLSRCEILAATGLTVSQFRHHAEKVAKASNAHGGRWVRWGLIGLPSVAVTVQHKINAALDAARADGLYVHDIVRAADASQSQVKTWLSRGEDTGDYAWHSHRSMKSARRRIWYLAKHKPEQPPAPVEWEKKPKARKRAEPKPVKVKPAKSHKMIRGGWAPDTPADMSMAVLTVARTPRGKFDVDLPQRSNLDPRDCNDWARAAAPG